MADRPGRVDVKRNPRAILALLAVTVIWGWTFVWMKQSLNAAASALGHPGGPAVVCLYIGARFAIAAIALAFWPRARAGLDRGAWRGGFILGALLAVGFLFQMLGLEGVTPPVSAFLTSLYVVFAAVLTAWLHRTRPRVALMIGVLMATFGAGFIEGPPQLTFGLAEWLTVACAVVFAVHILATDRVTKAHPPLAVTLSMFVWTAVLTSAALAVYFGSGHVAEIRPVFLLLRVGAFVVPLVLASILATVVALTLMNVYQRELDPVRAAILYALEPIWTTLIAAALGLGFPSYWLWIGGGALVAGNLIAELGVTAD
jgi:drug/metabolite transporter (DMT)-like permease